MLSAVRAVARALRAMAVAAAVVVAASGCVRADVPEAPTYLGLDYGGTGDPAQALDVYLPEGPGPHPTVIFVHGGAWAFGSRRMPVDAPGGYGDLRRTLLGRGFAVASVDYRFLDRALFPAQLHDVKAAIRYLRANAVRLDLDPKRFVAMGDSAGGHLAEMAGYARAVPELEGSVGVPGDSSVAAVVSYFGVSDLADIIQDRRRARCGVRPSRKTYEARLLGVDPSTPQGRPVALAASPITYVSASSPPTLLLHGTRDCIVPLAQSQRLQEALEKAGVDTQLELIPIGHADRRFYTDATLRARLVEFLDRVAR
ncbi:alpha/beta hydrolase [Nigerium massiliense]|uniref:alpha/beta hydrolase n=1 Tax=Nigerium massiliense TaxID=1522317 RepID=UPI000694AAC3|nr:alpha/beta hydrolase [Nigerium massiliense]